MPYLVTATWDDVPHLTEKQKSDLWGSIPAHERDARSKGIPTLGSGLIFPVAEEDIVVAPFALPKHWPQIGGMDFGYDHPFAAVKLAHDRDNDIIYVTAEYRKSQATPVIHAAALKPWGAWLPWAWPHDGLRKDKDASGKEYSALYEEQGLAMLREKATFEDGGNGVEAGLIEMLDRMQTGRWKVFSTCRAWLEERRLYHRKNGVVVKERDDALSASRYAFVTLQKSDFDNARRIVNGTDKASEIADIARDYDAALKAFGYGEDKPTRAASPVDTSPTPPAATSVSPQPPATKRGLLDWILSLFTGGR
jgi:hypothetical protein